MSLPHRHQVDFARRKGKVPYPCFYCANKSVTVDYVTDEHNIVKEFGKDGDVPQICNAGLHKPTEYGDCKHALIVELPCNVKRSYPSEIFTFFSREYMLEMITDILYLGYATKSQLIARGRKGYHTREQRIKELYEIGYIDMGYNVDNEEIYHLTSNGEDIAYMIVELCDVAIKVNEYGDSLEFAPHLQVFEYVRNHSNCTRKQIYDHFDKNYDYNETLIPCVVDELVNDRYIEPIYNSDYSEIVYNTTQRGVDRWLRSCRE